MQKLTTCIVTLLALLSLAGTAVAQAPAATAPSTATPAPACQGTNLVETLRRERPDAWSRIAATATMTSNAQALLWRIERPGISASHLYGTVHLTDDRVNRLSQTVMTALDAAKVVALEVADLSPAAMAPALAKLQDLLVYDDGRSLERTLSTDEQSQARRALERTGTPAAALAALRPWVVTMMLALSDCERRRAASGLTPLDSRLGESARRRDIPVAGLETLGDQLRAMAKVPENDQLIMLKASLKLYPRADDLIETMVQLYLSRDLGKVWPLQEELWREAGFDPASFATFRSELVTARNVTMRNAALPHLEQGRAFIAVGALHLQGPGGLVELLRGAGYKLTAIE